MDGEIIFDPNDLTAPRRKDKNIDAKVDFKSLDTK
jgi:hypothetical protein